MGGQQQLVPLQALHKARKEGYRSVGAEMNVEREESLSGGAE
jgi:hypothetical protein